MKKFSLNLKILVCVCTLIIIITNTYNVWATDYGWERYWKEQYEIVKNQPYLTPGDAYAELWKNVQDQFEHLQHLSQVDIEPFFKIFQLFAKGVNNFTGSTSNSTIGTKEAYKNAIKGYAAAIDRNKRENNGKYSFNNRYIQS